MKGFLQEYKDNMELADAVKLAIKVSIEAQILLVYN